MFRPLFLLVGFLVLNISASAQTSLSLFNEAKELQKSGKDSKAIKKYEEALEKAESERNKEVQMSCHLELAGLKDNVINYREALDHYEAFSKLYHQQLSDKNKTLQDSVSGLKTKVDSSQEQIELQQSEIQQKDSDIKKKNNEIDSLTTEYLQAQLANKELELENQKNELALKASENRRNILLFSLAIAILAGLFIGRGYFLKRKGVRVLRQKNYEIVMEKQKSDRLLLNILPEKIAEELKEFNKTTPARFDHATVMFTDFKGFTKYAENNAPEELIALVDHYFQAFDRIVEKYNIEKIKTIGDAYLCVSGIPEANENHAANMIRAAFEFRDFVNQTELERKGQDLPYLQMRIGIHTGPLVAGVVGLRKFAYDVWGDTVNVAARMEQSGEPRGINVSQDVYDLAGTGFEFTFRGEVEAKNKGKLKMYFVNPGK